MLDKVPKFKLWTIKSRLFLGETFTSNRAVFLTSHNLPFHLKIIFLVIIFVFVLYSVSLLLCETIGGPKTLENQRYFSLSFSLSLLLSFALLLSLSLLLCELAGKGSWEPDI